MSTCFTFPSLFQAAGLHKGHGESHSGSFHEDEDKSFLWKFLLVVAGVYVFFVFETVTNLFFRRSIVHSHDTEVKYFNSEISASFARNYIRNRVQFRRWNLLKIVISFICPQQIYQPILHIAISVIFIYGNYYLLYNNIEVS